jgi:hypothetical protein
MEDRAAIIEVTIGYSTALDKRDWKLLEEVFVPEVVIEYSTGTQTQGRDQVIGHIRNMLSGCGPTQHLLSNHVININGDRATSTCQVRAFAAGAPTSPQAGKVYELFGAYHDHLVRTPAGWRIVGRRMDVNFELGDRAVLGA